MGEIRIPRLGLSDVDYPLIARLANRFKEPSSWAAWRGCSFCLE
jgi:hypothetical protein